jgi:hypothetical protein
MLSKIRDGQPWWFLPVVAFLVGLFIGWLVIGWGVWPVTYKNSLPQDLRAAEQQEYLLMTAESFAANGDLAAARRRLAMWPQDELSKALNTLEERLQADNPLQATQVQLLAASLALPAPSGEGAGTAPAVEPEPASDGSELLQTALTTALWVLLVLGGILGIIYLWRRWQSSSQPSQPAIEELTPQPTVRDTGMRPFPEMADASGDQGERVAAGPAWPRTGPAREVIVYEDEDIFEQEAYEAVPAPGEAATEGGELEAEPDLAQPAASRQAARPEAAPVVTAPVATAAGVMTKVGEWQAQYELGASDYDEAFDIYDTNGAYIGQCGLELVDPVGRAHDQAAALQVWLWDTNDPDTKVKVLMSEGAYRDAAMRDQLAGEHEVVPIRAGTGFELRSYNLLLKGIVDKIEYAEQEPAGAIFSELQARIAVYL